MQNNRLPVAKPKFANRHRDSDTANSVQIELAEQQDRFLLANLTNPQWLARQSGFLFSLAVHLVLLLVLSSFLIHKVGNSPIVLLSLRLFTHQIPAISNNKAESIQNSVVSWKNVWSSNHRAVRPSDYGNDLVFLYMVAEGGETPFKLIEELNLESISPIVQIELARKVIEYQSLNPREFWKATPVLANIFAGLNKVMNKNFNAEVFVRNSTPQSCRRRLDRIIKNRTESAGSLYRKLASNRVSQEARLAAGNQLIQQFPETEWADMAQDELKIPVSEQGPSF